MAPLNLAGDLVAYQNEASSLRAATLEGRPWRFEPPRYTGAAQPEGRVAVAENAGFQMGVRIGRSRGGGMRSARLTGPPSSPKTRHAAPPSWRAPYWWPARPSRHGVEVGRRRATIGGYPTPNPTANRSPSRLAVAGENGRSLIAILGPGGGGLGASEQPPSRRSRQPR